MTEHATLKAEARTRTGKGSARAARREGKIPAIVYSHFAEPASIALDPIALRKAVVGSVHRFNTVLTLEIDGSGQRTALLKDWQVDPVSRRLLHADFLEIRQDEQLEVEVPVVITGKSEGVTNGGILNQIRRAVTVKCLPKDIPAQILADITPLDMNDSLHVADLPVPESVQLVYSTNYTVVVVTPPEKEPVVETDELALGLEPGAVPAEGAEETPAEGEGEGDGE